jgi:sugar lactone lactonase YvrE
MKLLGKFSSLSFVVATFLMTSISPALIAIAQPPSPPTASGTRPASAVYPLDGAVDHQGSVWIVDRNKPGVWRFQGDSLELVITGEKKFRKPLNAVRCIAISPSGELTVGDPATREIYRRNEQGEMVPTTGGLIGIPVDLAYASDGTLYIADVERRVIWKQSSASDKPTVFASVNPRGLFVDSKERLWVVTQDEKQVLRYDSSGTQEAIVSERLFEFPHQIVVDSQDRAWVTDGYKKGVWMIPPGAAPTLAYSGEPFQNPVGLFLIEDTPAIVDPHAQQVFRLRDGKIDPWIRIEAN